MQRLSSPALVALCLLICMTASCHGSSDLDAEAIDQAKPKFLEKFVPDGPFYILMIKDPWKGLMQFKEVLPMASANSVSEADKMNGVTWHGQVTYGAKFMRFFLDDPNDVTQKSEMKAGDWEATTSRFGKTLFIADVEQRNGKWTVETDRVDDFARPTEAQLKRLDAVLKTSGGN